MLHGEMTTAGHAPAHAKYVFGFFFLAFATICCAVHVQPASAQTERSVARQDRGWLGMELRRLTGREREMLRLQSKYGVAVSKIEEGAPAAQAHLAADDVILSINGRNVASAADVFAVTGNRTAGVVIKLQVLRQGRVRTLFVRLGKRQPTGEPPVSAAAPTPAFAPVAVAAAAPPEKANQPSPTAAPAPTPVASPAPVVSPQPATPATKGRPFIGMGLRAVSPTEAAGYGWGSPRGAYITAIAPQSPAEKARLAKGNVVLSINGMTIANDADALTIIRQQSPGDTLQMTVLQDSRENTIMVIVGERATPKRSAVNLMLDAGGHTSPVVSVAFTPDGKEVVSASNDKTVRVWDIERGMTTRIIRGDIGPGVTGAIYTMALSPDGQWLAVGGMLHDDDVVLGSAVRLYEFGTGKLVALLKGHSNAVTALAFSPDSKRLISGSGDTSAIVWDVAEHRQLFRLMGHTNWILSVAFTNDGARVVTGSKDETLRLWDMSDGHMIAEMIKHREYATPEPGQHKIWDGHVTSLAVSPVEDVIASGGADGRVLLWNSETGEFLRVLAFPGGTAGYATIWGLGFSPEGRWLNACSQAEGSFIIETKSGFEQYNGRVNDKPLSMWQGVSHEKCTGGSRYNDDGKLIAVAYNNTVQLIDAATSKPIKTLDSAGSTINGVGFSEDGRAIAWGYGLRSTKGDQPSELTSRFRLPLDGVPLVGAEEIAAGSGDVFVRNNPKFGTKALRFKPVDNIGVKLGFIQIAEEGQPPVEFERELTKGNLWDPLGFTPDGQSIIALNGANIVHHSLNGKVLGEYAGHQGEVRTFAVSSNGRFLLSGGADKTLRLWNLGTHELVVSLFVTKYGEWLMWTPQGYYASSPGGDSIIGWQISRGADKEPDYVSNTQLRRHLNRPDIVTRAVELASATAAIKEAPGTTFNIDELLSKPVPRIRILSPAQAALASGGRAEVEVAIEPGSDPVRRLRIQVNGIHIAEKLPVHGAGFDPGVQKVLVPLARGRNTIHLEAINNTGVTAADVIINHDGEGRLDTRGTLYIVAIGVDKYPNVSGGDLRYSGADARAFTDAVEKRAGPLHKKVVKRVLINGGAPDSSPTKANIENALGLLADATENDTVMVFVAGHGHNEGANYRFLPTDTAAAGGRFVPATIVPWYAFQEAVESAKGRRILFLDTCHAGNAYNQALSNQAYHANIVVYSAARWDQSALEEPNLGGTGHGLFTYSVVEGLDGAAHNPANEISTTSLRDFVNRRVKELAAKLRANQEPQFFQGRDAQDYVLGRLQ